MRLGDCNRTHLQLLDRLFRAFRHGAASPASAQRTGVLAPANFSPANEILTSTVTFAG
jgi:hypothetical protein